MQRTLWTACLLTALTCACSTVSEKQTLPYYPAPQLKLEETAGMDPVSRDHWLEKKFREEPTEPVRFLTRYLQAQLWSPTDPAKACSLWLEVSNQPRFPLSRVARLRALETCPADRGAFPSISKIVSTADEPWLKEAVTRAALARAIRIGDKTNEMKLTAEASQFEKLQRGKVAMLLQAIALAEELNESAAREEYHAQLKAIAPRFNTEPTLEQYMAVANDFRQVREFEKAREFYRRLVNDPAANELDKLRAIDGIRMTYKLEKNTEKYLAATTEHSTFARESLFEKAKKAGDRALLAKYFDAQLSHARALWTENATKEAQAILAKAEKDMKGKTAIEESVLIRARIEEEAGRFDATSRILEKIDIARVPDRGLRARILWHRAWNLRKIGRMKDAIAIFEQLTTEEESPTLLARDRFWLGRTLSAAGENARATAEFEWLIENDPMGFYGLLAYRELKRQIPPLAPPEIRQPAGENEFRVPSSQAHMNRQHSALDPESRVIAEWLIAARESDLGRRFLDFASYGRRGSLGEDQSIDLLQLYARTGNYQTLYVRLSELSPDRRRRVLETQPHLVFPQPWPDLVAEASNHFKVPKELIYSIMRQESSFNPLARSPADAFGLMQLIPESAKRAEKATGIALAHPEDLYKPEVNITLGSAFLRELLDKWNDQFILSVASYNASEKAIAGWMKTRFKGEPLEFIEDIPYEETRNYVKLVMRNYVFYSRLNSGGAPIAFPEGCLANLQDIKP